MIGRSLRPMFLVRSGDAVHVSPRRRRLEQPVAAEIHRARVVGRQHERRAPVEAEVRSRRRGRDDVAGTGAAAATAATAAGGLRRRWSRRAGAATLRVGLRRGWCRRRGKWRRGADRLRLTGPEVVAVGGAVLRLRVDDRPVARIVGRVEAVAAADAIPVGVHDAGRAPHRARAAPAPLSCRPPHT